MKDSYLKKLKSDKTLLIDSFYINLFGILGLLEINPNSAILKNFFRQNMNTRIDHINHKYYSELYVTIQLLKENEYLKWWIANDLLKLLNKIKFGEEELELSYVLRKILRQVVVFSTRFSSRIEILVKKFVSGVLDLNELISQLYIDANMLGIAKEFQSIAKFLDRKLENEEK